MSLYSCASRLIPFGEGGGTGCTHCALGLVSPRFSKGFSKVLVRFHQGFAKVLVRFHQGFAKVLVRFWQGFYKGFTKVLGKALVSVLKVWSILKAFYPSGLESTVGM